MPGNVSIGPQISQLVICMCQRQACQINRGIMKLPEEGLQDLSEQGVTLPRGEEGLEREKNTAMDGLKAVYSRSHFPSDLY